MDLIEDIHEEKRLVQESIRLFGSSPEHNFFHYMNIEEPGGKNVFISFGQGRGILAQYFKGYDEWLVVGDVLAPENERLELLFEAISSCKGKFVVEATPDFRKKIIGSAEKSGLTVGKPRFSLYWPIFDFMVWNGEFLEGGDWKKLRNIRNHLLNSHKIEIRDSIEFPKERLGQLVMDWVKGRNSRGFGVDRKSNNKAYYDRYLKLVNSCFEGVKFAKTVAVDGEPCSITAGWDIPNSDNGYYSAIGIYDYKFDGIGEFANIEDLGLIKASGCKFADFGGSPKPLLDFKMKFKPTSVYKTLTFAIRKS